MEEKNGVGVRVLPHVFVDGVDWVIDLRLREFRETNSRDNSQGNFRGLRGPWVSIRFDSDRGRELCEMVNIVTCSLCGVSGIVPYRYRRCVSDACQHLMR